MRLTTAFAAVLVTAVVASCTAPPDRDEDMTPVEMTASTPSPSSSTAVDSNSTLDGPVVRASAETIAPDPELVASMECEPLSAETRSYFDGEFGAPPVEPVQVLVGEGLTPGELWWVVVSDPDWKRADGLNQWLTNQPGLGGDEVGTWIPIGALMESPDGTWASSFDNVHWDYDRLLRGRSALEKAFSCLGGQIVPQG